MSTHEHDSEQRQSFAPSPVRGLGELIALLPFQLGYQPTNSLVLVCLRAEPTRAASLSIVLTARIEMPADAVGDDLAHALAPAFDRSCPDAVVCVGFEGELTDSSAVLSALKRRALATGVAEVRCARVWDNHWCDWGTDGSAWQPIPEPESVPSVADSIVRGSNPLAGRAELETLLATRSSPEQQRAVHSALAIMRDPQPPTEVLVQALQLSGQILADPTCEPSFLSVDDLAALALLLAWTPGRDALIQAAAPGLVPVGHEDPLVALAGELVPSLGQVDDGAAFRFAKLCAALPASVGPAPWACGAYFAWWVGNGSLANIALERSLEIQPDYRLAQLLDTALRHAMPPSR